MIKFMTLQAIEKLADELSPFVNEVSRGHFGAIYCSCKGIHVSDCLRKQIPNYVYIPKLNHNFVHLIVATLAILLGCIKHIGVFFCMILSNYWCDFSLWELLVVCLWDFFLYKDNFISIISVSIIEWSQLYSVPNYLWGIFLKIIWYL